MYLAPDIILPARVTTYPQTYVHRTSDASRVGCRNKILSILVLGPYGKGNNFHDL